MRDGSNVRRVQEKPVLPDLALIAIAQWLACLIVEDPGNLPPCSAQRNHLQTLRAL